MLYIYIIYDAWTMVKVMFCGVVLCVALKDCRHYYRIVHSYLDTLYRYISNSFLYEMKIWRYLLILSECEYHRIFCSNHRYFISHKLTDLEIFAKSVIFCCARSTYRHINSSTDFRKSSTTYDVNICLKGRRYFRNLLLFVDEISRRLCICDGSLGLLYSKHSTNIENVNWIYCNSFQQWQTGTCAIIHNIMFQDIIIIDRAEACKNKRKSNS